MDYIWHSELLNFLATGDYPEGLSRDEKRNYRRKAKSFETKGDNTLFYIQGKARLQVILEGQTEAIMKELHGGTVHSARISPSGKLLNDTGGRVPAMTSVISAESVLCANFRIL